MKFSFYGNIHPEVKIFDLESTNIGAVVLSSLFNVPLYKVSCGADIIDGTYAPFASISWHIYRNNGKSVVISLTGNFSELLVSLFDADGNLTGPESWEQVMEWGR